MLPIINMILYILLIALSNWMIQLRRPCNWLRICKPGGHVIVKVPDEDCLKVDIGLVD